jgi:hypothetical protein
MKQTLLPLHSTRPYDSVDLPEILVQFTGIQTLDVNIDSDPLIKAVAIGAIAFLTVWNCFGKFIEVRLEIMDMIHQKSISPDDITMTISGPKTSLWFC